MAAETRVTLPEGTRLWILVCTNAVNIEASSLSRLSIRKVLRVSWKLPYPIFPRLVMNYSSFKPSDSVFKACDHQLVHIVTIDEAELLPKRHILDAFLDTVDGVIGLAPVYGSRCVLTALAMSSPTTVLLIQFPKKLTKMNPSRILLQDRVLCQSGIQKVALWMDKLAASLFLDSDLRITRAVDLLSARAKDRCSLNAIMTTLGGECTLVPEKVKTLFKKREAAGTSNREAAEQAWAACRVPGLTSMAKQVSNVSRIDTQTIGITHLSFLAKTLRDADLLDSLKPTRVKNDFSTKFDPKSGSAVLNVNSERFKTRIMASRSQTIEVVGTHHDKPMFGRATKVDGRAATIKLRGNFQGNRIKEIWTVGKEDPTGAEALRAAIILKGLQQRNTILTQPFVQSIWLPNERITWPPRQVTRATQIHFPYRPLNTSQTRAVAEIISNKNPISLVHGPPGTGKTSVIAASVINMMSGPSPRTVWLIAQSNVAVKNIAEKLAEVGFLNFRLLVSKDFHFDWHEHLYEKIKRNVIESSEFPEDALLAQRMLLGTRVILCTISTITSARLAFITMQAPVECVIVDEASQIEIGQYLPLLSRYEKTLQKLVFIGDDKQLAPYGQDDLGCLRSVFEMPHLQRNAIFLDTQYRMPAPIGHFISRKVYGGKLRTQHAVTAHSSCRFKDVRNGKEGKVGGSFANQQEVIAVMAIARLYHKTGKAYRIITPYDAQRNKLEKELKASKLPWQDKCFNVDSFQGTIVVISVQESGRLITCLFSRKRGRSYHPVACPVGETWIPQEHPAVQRHAEQMQDEHGDRDQPCFHQWPCVIFTGRSSGEGAGRARMAVGREREYGCSEPKRCIINFLLYLFMPGGEEPRAQYYVTAPRPKFVCGHFGTAQHLWPHFPVSHFRPGPAASTFASG
ncbi:hypothetical protein FIBSPDRAFT_195553 [Athelia psychrophila]|uniref:DNA2/NAM7 helicase-like C-terminal domain-containing protein n=1 Tax=Athelia psychrophila TaxID=1759441 RepID=A0A165ZX74_9AGAM|nr:hypothetical protein FIBSPDRAFT_195553 [Fibularhizoctonia sp. CBS 109695]